MFARLAVEGGGLAKHAVPCASLRAVAPALLATRFVKLFLEISDSGIGRGEFGLQPSKGKVNGVSVFAESRFLAPFLAFINSLLSFLRCQFGRVSDCFHNKDRVVQI